MGLAVLAGCTAPREPLRIDSRNPQVKILAMKQAAERMDRTKLPLLIDQLDNDDAAVRFYAIESLRRITGEQFGYNYYDPMVQRSAAIERWKQWLNQSDRVQK